MNALGTWSAAQLFGQYAANLAAHQRRNCHRTSNASAGTSVDAVRDAAKLSLTDLGRSTIDEEYV